MSGRFVVKHIGVGNNPRGVTYSPDGAHAYVANALDDSVTVIETTGYTVSGKINLGGPAEITDIRWGERLFHSADMTFARQFSCRGCHPDGHMNGLGFDIEADGIGLSPVDNRTLRGIVDTAPFKWEGTNPSLDFQCGPRLAVFFTRLAPFTPAELEALVRYECTIESPHNPHRGPNGLTLAQRRGKEVFDRTVDNRGGPIPPDKRCVNCHNNPYKTSRKQMAVGTTMWFDTPVDVEIKEMYGAEAFGELGTFLFADSGAEQKVLDVPHLINIHDSAPYLHNGSAATLEEIWTRYNMVEGHGFTGDLTRRQFNDLIAYLKAL
jgi:YVTN family beta-propeller protein